MKSIIIGIDPEHYAETQALTSKLGTNIYSLNISHASNERR